MVSTSSCGSLLIGDGRVVDTSGVPPKNNHMNLALVRYQSWLTMSSLAVAVSTQCDFKWKMGGGSTC